jgi:PAS domain S-box-containing protein
VISKVSEPRALLEAVSQVLGSPPHVLPPPEPANPDPQRVQLLTAELPAKVREVEAVNAQLMALVDLSRQLILEADPLRLVETYCQEARNIIGARYAAIGLLAESGDRLAHFFFHGAEVSAAALPAPDPAQGLLAQVLAGRRPIRVRQLSDLHDAALLPPPHPRQGSFLGVAIASSSQLYGLLYLVDKQGAEFTDQDEHLAATLAAQIGVAYRGALQSEHLKQYAARLKTEVDERAQVEKSLRDTQEFLTRLLENIPAPVYVHSASGQIMLLNRAWEGLFNKDRAEAIGKNVRDLYPPELSQFFLSTDQQVLQAGQPLVFEEIQETIDGGRAFFTVKFPLPDPAGGVEAIAGVSIDITDRKRAEANLQEHANRLQVLSRRLVAIQEEERRRIAGELHDEIGQLVTGISINLHALEDLVPEEARSRVNDSIALADQAIHQVRDLAVELRPAMLDVLGLEAALRWLAGTQAQRGRLDIEVQTNLAGSRLDGGVETVCYRIVQEALTNIVRHAQARRAAISMEREAAELRLTIGDDGIGFDVAAARQRAAEGGSFGLLGMQERGTLLHGQIDIASQPSRGTEIRVRIPLPMPKG